MSWQKPDGLQNVSEQPSSHVITQERTQIDTDAMAQTITLPTLVSLRKKLRYKYI